MDALTLKHIIGKSEYTFIATLEKISPMIVQPSMPPIYHTNMQFTDFENVKGPVPQPNTSFHYSIRSSDEPKFDISKKYIVCGHVIESKHVADTVVEYSEELLHNRSILPAGWMIFEGDKLLSPFPAVQPPPKWYEDFSEEKCSKTGRPALLAGPNVELIVEQVIPPNAQEYSNPFGDGKFKVTIANKANENTTVHALLQEDGKISWEDSIVVIDGETEKVYTLPGCCEKQHLKPYILKPLEKVSAIINTLALACDDYWFCGGIRVYLKFALGEVTKDNFFYCYSMIHEKMHSDALNKCAVEC